MYASPTTTWGTLDTPLQTTCPPRRSRASWETSRTAPGRGEIVDYSAAGQLATVIYPNGSAISAGYDAAGRQTSSQVFSPTDPQLYHLTYDYTDANNIDSALLQSVSDVVGRAW